MKDLLDGASLVIMMVITPFSNYDVVLSLGAK